MKKSERKRMKRIAIYKAKVEVKHAKIDVKEAFPTRHIDNPDWLHAFVGRVHQALFTLRAMEKQMPMPVKTHKGCAKCVCSGNGRAYLYNYHNYYCQNCNGLILHDMPDYPKYCPHCGQKLWWK